MDSGNDRIPAYVPAGNHKDRGLNGSETQSALAFPLAGPPVQAGAGQRNDADEHKPDKAWIRAADSRPEEVWEPISASFTGLTTYFLIGRLGDKTVQSGPTRNLRVFVNDN